MPTPLIPQEIYLIERYSSLDYYEKMHKAWKAMLDHLEYCYDQFMNHLPADYRKRGLPYQPDSAWGQTVLPNFRDTMQLLDEGYLKMLRGDLSGMRAAHAVTGDMRGVVDYWDGWLGEVSPDALGIYGRTSTEASHHAGNIAISYDARWIKGALTANYYERGRGPLNPPPSWPIYRLNPAVTTKSGDPVPQTGIYLPDVDDSSPQLLVQGEETMIAYVGYDPKRLQNVSEADAIWTLVERIADSGGVTGSGPQGENSNGKRRPNVPANTPCPEAGWWFTPAQANSRRYFKQGEVMPSVGGDYGDTFWQWSPDQSAPTL